MSELPILLIPEKADLEYTALIDTWERQNGEVRRLGKYWVIDPSLTGREIAIYGNQAFSLVLAQLYNVTLISPDNNLIAKLDIKWTKRTILIKQLKELTDYDFPCFIKPVIPKLFIAGIFQQHENFLLLTNGLMDTESILISGIIEDIKAEVRSFVLNGHIMDMAFYEGATELAEAEAFLKSFLSSIGELLPVVVVIDLGYSERLGWFILEFNACWGAGLNNCRADNVLECIRQATINIR